jgi:diguanylate cyclase
MIIYLQAESSKSIIEINDAKKLLSSGTQVYFFEDTTKKLTFGDVLKPENQARFEKSDKDILNLGLPKNPFWIRIHIKNNTDEKIYMQLGESGIFFIDFYKNGHLINQTGSLRDFSTRMVNSNLFIFDLDIKKNENVSELYFRIDSNTHLRVPVFIGTLESIYSMNHYNDLLYAMSFGFILIMIAYHIFLLIMTRDKGYLYYVLTFTILLFSYTTIYGNYLYEFLNIKFLNAHWLSINNIWFLWMYLYLDSVLRLKKNYPVLFRIIKYQAFFQLILAVLMFIEPYWSSLICYGTANIFHISVVVILSYLSLKGNISARLILVGASSFLISIIIYIFYSFNILPSNIITNNILIFGNIVEILFSSLALSNKINSLRREKEKAQEEAIFQANENRRILSEQNTLLENIVKEKTSDLLASYNKMEKIAITDSLTGLFNRRHFNSVAEMEFKNSIRGKKYFSLIMMDLDNFKKINDTYGHPVGDEVLIASAKVILSVIKRPGDVIARYGGEEFIVLLVSTNLAGTKKVAEDMRSEIEQIQVSIPEIKITASFGVYSSVPTIGESFEMYVKVADEGLYTAKQSGRNQVCGIE